MATRTSAAAGNWSTPGTWSGGIPGDGDSAIINHAVAVSANQTVGTSPASAGTVAITVNTGGGLTINAGITLVAKGPITYGDAPYTMGAGAILEFDASGATDPMNQHYLFTVGNYTASFFSIVGTAGARCQIRSNASGGSAALAAPSGYCHLTFHYCDFTRMGRASVPCLQNREWVFDLEQCVFDTCGKISIGLAPAIYVTRLVNVTMKNTTDANYSVDGAYADGALSTGSRVMQSCVFDKSVFSGFWDWTVTDTVFTSPTAGPIIATGTHPWVTCSGNLFVGTTDTLIHGDVVDSYYFNRASTNAHYFQPIRPLTIRGTIFEYENTADNGDCVQMIGGGLTNVIVEHCLGLPNGGTGGAGTILSFLGTSDSVGRSRHNTWFVNGQAALTLGETYVGVAGNLAEFRDNLVYALPGATKGKLDYIDNPTCPTDMIAAANAHHNAGYNLAAGSNLKGYNALVFSSGAPGANDVDGTDPDFVDAARNLKTWDASIAGGAGSVSHALTELGKKNESGYNASYTIAALIAYVKAGFVPQAGALQAASDSVAPSNGWIGALEGVAAAPPGWTVLAHAKGGSPNGIADAVSGTFDSTGADLIVAVIGEYDRNISGFASTIIDSKVGNTWVPRTLYINPGPAVSQVRIWYTTPNPSTGRGPGHTVAAHYDSATAVYSAITVLALSGAHATPYDTENGDEGVASATRQAGPATPTEDNELVIAAGCASGVSASLIDSGLTIIENQLFSSGANVNCALAYKILGAGTAGVAVNPQWTMTGPESISVAIATFKGSAVAAGGTDHSRLMLLGVGA